MVWFNYGNTRIEFGRYQAKRITDAKEIIKMKDQYMRTYRITPERFEEARKELNIPNADPSEWDNYRQRYNWRPKNKVKGKFDIRDVNITHSDKYNSRGKKGNFDKFVTGLETSNKSNKLKEVLMRLFSQFMKDTDLETPVKISKWLKKFPYKNLRTHSILLHKYLTVYQTLIKQYNADLIAKQDIPSALKPAKKDSSVAFTIQARKKFNENLNLISLGKDIEIVKKDVAIPGSIAYLSTISHGLSHTQFWDAVEEKLRTSFVSGLKTKYKKNK